MSRMACTWTERDEAFEGYLCDSLSPEDRDAFEAHYFECAACFDKLQTYQALRAELRAGAAEVPATPVDRARAWRWALVPAAAALVVLAAFALWLRGSAPVVPEGTVAVAPVPASPAPATAPQAPTVPPPAAPAAAEPERKPASPAVVALSVLARVEAPIYIPVALRGPRDEAAERFEAAMRHYVNGDYAGAIPVLSGAADLNPNATHVVFFLAICHLLTDRVGAAIEGLQKTIALGESAYLEEAHFYLAKARLRQGDVQAARRDLRQTIERRGRLEGDARRLLAQLDALPPRR